VTTTLDEFLPRPVLRPGDAGFSEEVSGFNVAHPHEPDVVIAAERPEDVVTAVRWAADQGVGIGVQATGHGANAPMDGGLLVSTRRMNAVSVDPRSRTATVGAGATWRGVLRAASPHGLGGLCGSSSGVGVVGYTVGGGLPLLGRAYGWAAERVRAMDVVTADGLLRHVDAETEPELFWALRGGKGNVGIVTSMSFELLPLTRLYGGSVFFDGSHAAVLLRAYADWTTSLPDAMCTALQLLRLPPLPDVPEPLRGRFTVQLCVAWPGDPVEGERLVAPMRAVAPAIADMIRDMPYSEVDAVFHDPEHPVPATEGCLLLPAMPEAATATLLELAGPDARTPLLAVAVRHLGGALARPPAVPDAVGPRDAAYVLQTVGVLAGPHAEDVPAAAAALRAAVEPWSTGRTFVNLHGRPGDDADRARAWSGDTYERLRQVKGHYDPAGLLRFGHAVPPPREPSEPRWQHLR
jgi:FAD/FMN-containing dehydrogenase